MLGLKNAEVLIGSILRVVLTVEVAGLEERCVENDFTTGNIKF